MVKQAAQLPKQLPKVAVFVSAASLKRNHVADVSPTGACPVSLRNQRLTFTLGRVRRQPGVRSPDLEPNPEELASLEQDSV